jgi:hypothetical protein
MAWTIGKWPAYPCHHRTLLVIAPNWRPELLANVTPSYDGAGDEPLPGSPMIQ